MKKENEKWRDTAKSIPQMEREAAATHGKKETPKSTAQHPDSTHVQKTHFGYIGAYA